jgi:integrase
MAGPPGRRHARDFLRWACRQRLASNVDIVRRPDPTPGRSANAEHHLALARRFATDENLPLVDRVAGLLLLCYGQPLARLARMKVADVAETDGGDTAIQFGRSLLVLAEPIAGLVRQLVANPHRRATTGAPDLNPWLFGGGQPGRAMSTDRLGLRLAAYGIDAREARTSLMLDLAGELAPAFLADLLGMHPGTAVRWVRAAGGDWAGYVAARARARG